MARAYDINKEGTVKVNTDFSADNEFFWIAKIQGAASSKSNDEVT